MTLMDTMANEAGMSSGFSSLRWVDILQLILWG